MNQKKINVIFKKIENTRKKNNSNWMAILKLAYESNSRQTIKVLNNILKKDQHLISLAKLLTNKK